MLTTNSAYTILSIINRRMSYSFDVVVIVIVIVALAEELLALLILLVTSLLGTLVSAIEMPVSLKPSKIKPAIMIAKMIRKNGLFTPSSLNSIIGWTNHRCNTLEG